MRAAKETLGFKYERKDIKKDAELPSLCPDYKPDGGIKNCKKAEFCKNATHKIDGVAFGFCYGGTKQSEREERQEKTERALAYKNIKL